MTFRLFGPGAAAAACICVIAGTGCTSYRVVAVAPSSVTSRAVEPGDRVRVTHVDKRSSEFKVTRVTGAGLEGRNVSIPAGDISRLEVRRLDRKKTWGLVGAFGGVMLTAVAIYAYAHSKLYEEAWDEEP
jgi:hypothetical protein